MRPAADSLAAPRVRRSLLRDARVNWQLHLLLLPLIYLLILIFGSTCRCGGANRVQSGQSQKRETGVKPSCVGRTHAFRPCAGENAA